MTHKFNLVHVMGTLENGYQNLGLVQVWHSLTFEFFLFGYLDN